MSETRISELDNVCALDLETSGLGEQDDQILEVAVVFGCFVDGSFVERSRVAIVLPIASNVEDWHPVVLEMHTKNGLFVEAMAERKRRVSSPKLGPPGKQRSAYEEADSKLRGVAPFLSIEQQWTLLGNSVHFDLRFVRRCFPLFAERLSHRVIDVSSIRLFCESLGRPYEKGEVAHRAMADVEASLREFAACQEWSRNFYRHEGAREYVNGDHVVDGKSIRDLITFRQDFADRDALANVVGHGAG